jgi:hypothetical protein
MTIFLFFSGVFGSLFSLSFGVEIRKLSGFNLSDFRIVSRLSELLCVIKNFVNHQIVRIAVILFGFNFAFGLRRGCSLGLKEGNVLIVGKFGFLVQSLKNLLQFSRLLFHAAI